MFKLPIPTRLTDYLGEVVVWTVIYIYIYIYINITYEQNNVYR